MKKIDRPLVFVLSVFLIGLFLCALLSMSGYIPLLCAILCIATGGFLFIRKKKVLPFAVICFLTALGLMLSALFSFTHFESYRRESARFDGVNVRVEGLADEVSHAQHSTTVTLTDVRINGEEIQTEVRLTTYQSGFRNIPKYARVYGEALLKAPKNLMFGFDQEYYLFSRGISLIGNTADAYWEENRDPPFYASVQRLQKTLGNYLTISCGNEIKALLLGDTSSADETLAEEMRVIGVSHIYSISGLHLTLLLSSVYHILFRLRVPRVVNTSVLVLFALFYMVITDFSPSVCRAGIMAALFYIALAVRRQSDGLTSLLFATACICIIDPFSVCHTGLQLSFLATLGIFTIGERTVNRFLSPAIFNPIRPRVFRFSLYLQWLGRRILRGACELLIINLTATAMTLPILLTISNEISLISPLANLLLVPLFNPILILSACYLLFCLCVGFILPIGYIFSYLADLCGLLTEGLFSVFRSIVHFFATMDFALVFTNYPFLPIVIAVFILGLSLCILLPSLTRFYPLLPVLFVLVFALSLGVYALTASDDIVMYKISARTDDKLIVCEEDSYIILEADSLGNTLSAQSANTLKQTGADRVAMYVLPSLNESDVERVEALAAVCPVERVFVPQKYAQAHRLIDRLRRMGAEVSTYRYGADIPLGNAVLRVYPSGENDVWFVWDNGKRRVCYGGKWADGIHTLPEPEEKYDLLFLPGKVSSSHPLFYAAAYTAFNANAMENVDFVALQKIFLQNGGKLFDMGEYKIAKATLGEEVTLAG